MIDKYDVLVIGTGPAGHGAAIQAAKLGKHVAAVERKGVGGTSVAAGSIPSKALRESILYLTGLRQREIHGLSYSLKSNITVHDLMLRREHVVTNEINVLRHQFSRNGVVLIEGEASFLSPNVVSVKSSEGTREIQAEYIVIATGSEPARSAKVPVNGGNIIDSDGVFRLPSIPSSMIVVGVGAIGAEYACMFAALDTEVTMVDMHTGVLEFLDAEIREALFYHMRDQGVIFRLGEEVVQVSEEGGAVAVQTSSNKRLVGQVLLFTIGRNGGTEQLNLEGAGLSADKRGRLLVNDHYQTSVGHIYAAGDVVGFPALASTSMEQGRVAVRHALRVNDNPLPSPIPYGLYTIPEISMVGATEEELTGVGVPYETGLARYRETARGQIIGDHRGMLKLLVHSESRRLLGVHILGEGAAELVHVGQAVIALGGTIDYLINSTFNYPTLAECYRIAALDAHNKLA